MKKPEPVDQKNFEARIWERDHNEFPEIVTIEGELLSWEQVALKYTREGRRVDGREYPNPIPLEPPLGYQPSLPIWDQIRAMISSNQSRDADLETEEEADDFEVGDDYDPHSPWEEQFHPAENWQEALAPQRVLNAAEELNRLEKERSTPKPPPTPTPSPEAPAGGGGAQPPSGQPKKDP